VKVTEQTGSARQVIRVVVKTLVIVVAVVLVLGLALFFGQRRLIYFPDRTNPGSIFDRNGQDIQFTTADGLTLKTWQINPEPDSRHVAVLYLPGNGGNRLDRLGVARDISALGYTVLLLEYRGYGGNPGSPSEHGLLDDALAAVGYLNSEGFDSAHIIYVGESIGTGVAVKLASVEPPAGVLLRSPFTSLADVAKHLYPWLPVSLIMQDRFETMKYLPDVTVPISVLAGRADTLVPFEQSATVAQHAPNLFSFDAVDGADHNDAVWFGPYLASQVDDLARAAVTR